MLAPDGHAAALLPSAARARGACRPRARTVRGDEMARVGLLLLTQVLDDVLPCGGVLQVVPRNLEVLEHYQNVDGAHLEALESVLDAKAELTGVLRDLLKVPRDEPLLLDELDVRERLRAQLDRLVEAVLAAVRHIDGFDDLGQYSRVEAIRLREVVFEVGGASEHDARHVDLIVGDEDGLGDLGDLPLPIVWSWVSHKPFSEDGSKRR